MVDETLEMVDEGKDGEDVFEADEDDVVKGVFELEVVLKMVLALELVVCRQVIPVQMTGRVVKI
jgi:hypothetical protein